MFVKLWGKNVTELHIGRNRIRRITEGMFKGAESVKFLDISDGGVRSIPNRAFRTLEYLRSLWLDMNAIGFLNQGMFCGLDRLRELNLNGNRIRFIMPGVFQNLPNLEHLYLDQNRIRHLPGNLFYGLQKLKHLSIANNQIRTIDQGVFNGLINSITFIDMSNTDPRGITIPTDMQSSYQLKCQDWEIEFGCKTLANFTENSGYFLFNTTNVVVPQDSCLTVEEMFNYTSETCSNHTDLYICCNGVSHVREIYGLTVDYWNNQCCGSMAYNDKVLTCCDGSLYPAQENVECCNNQLRTFDYEKEACCEDRVIDLNRYQCCSNGQIHSVNDYCPYFYLNRLQPFLDWFEDRYIGWIPHLEAYRKSGKNGKSRKGPVG